jgi:ankyrin repeat protein
MVAAWHGDLPALRLLVESGARLGLQDSGGRSILHWAALNRRPGSLELLRYLCGRNVDALLRDRYGQTCLHKAVETGCTGAAAIFAAEFPRLCVIEDRYDPPYPPTAAPPPPPPSPPPSTRPHLTPQALPSGPNAATRILISRVGICRIPSPT